MGKVNTPNSWIIYYVILQCTITCFGAVMHKKFHEHNEVVPVERDQDGAYSPKLDHEKYHYKSGEHQSNFDHEAILGNAKEAEEYDTLPPEVSKQRLIKLLGYMDTSQDALIDRSELEAWITKSFLMLSKEEAIEKFEETDDNEDGKIDWNEYLLDTYGSVDLSFESGSPEEDAMFKTEVDQDKALFDAVDVDRDGLLDKEEFVTFTNPEEHEHLWPLLLEQILHRKDIDKDRAINFKEFVGNKGVDMTKENLVIEKNQFDEYDTNKDGILSKSEIILWVFPQNQKIAEEEAAHLFAQSDDNHDDILTFDEILEHQDVFIGSEATNYGEHLHNIHEFSDEL